MLHYKVYSPFHFLYTASSLGPINLLSAYSRHTHGLTRRWKLVSVALMDDGDSFSSHCIANDSHAWYLLSGGQRQYSRILA